MRFSDETDKLPTAKKYPKKAAAAEGAKGGDDQDVKSPNRIHTLGAISAALTKTPRNSDAICIPPECTSIADACM